MLTPKRVFGAVAVVLLVTLLLVPPPQRPDQEGTLTSYDAGPRGARGLYDVLRRLGFTVDRRLAPMRQDLDSKAVYLVLEPPLAPTATEVHRLVEAVRAGARALVVADPGTRLADSLGLVRINTVFEQVNNDSIRRARQRDPLRRDWEQYVLRRRTRIGRRDSLTVFTPPAAGRTFRSLETSRGAEPVIAGLPYGRGRLLVVADARPFSNERMRDPDTGVEVVRMIEWLGEGAERSIVFDEYHHGFGRHADVMGVSRRALVGLPAGRVILQLAVAGLFLLFAIGTRALRPKPRTQIERRSALEHVGALSRAYAAVHASSRAAQLLVRGLRRRRGGSRGLRADVAYLRTVTSAHDELKPEVERVVRVLDGGASHDDRAGVTTAILRIERAITS